MSSAQQLNTNKSANLVADFKQIILELSKLHLLIFMLGSSIQIRFKWNFDLKGLKILTLFVLPLTEPHLNFVLFKKD
jgi:hypothetical protein